MKKREPIIIRPLTMRGVFGMAWNIFGRGFGAIAGFSLLYLLFACFIMAPWIISSATLYSTAEPWGGESMLRTSRALLTGLSLSGVEYALLYLVALPLYYGTLYNEMSARIYGAYGSFKDMLRRMRFTLKRFFLTNLCYVLCSYAIAVLVTTAALIMALLCALPIALSSVNGFSAADAVPLALIALAALFLEVVLSILLSFTYPAAVNENVKNMKAIGRSIALVSKRFSRTLACNLILGGILFVPSLLIVGGATYLLIESGRFSAAWLTCISLGWSALAALIITPYSFALNTVLYYDARVRIDGPGWLNYPEGEPSPGPEAIHDDTAPQSPRGGFEPEASNATRPEDPPDDDVWPEDPPDAEAAGARDDPLP